MHEFGHWQYWHMDMAFLFYIVLLLLVVGGIISFIQNSPKLPVEGLNRQDQAMDTLKKRYASGDINSEEFRQKKKIWNPKEAPMQVKDIMTPHPMCCSPLTNLKEVSQMMLEYDCGEIPVVENINNLMPIGVVTDRDIVCRAIALGKNPLEMTAGECMSKPCITVNPQTTLEDCCRTLKESHIRRIPVIDEQGRCCGIVSQADLATHSLDLELREVLKHVSQRR